MELRKLDLEDMNALKQFYQNNPLNEDREDLEDRQEEIEEELRINKFQYFGYLEEDELLGYGKLRCEGEEAHFIGPFVLPSKRRRGIGKEILNHIESHCRKKGKIRLNAYSFIDTNLATDFLTSQGYKLESVDELGVNVYTKEFTN
ncbi:MAG: GNAT family N-acetyltransferase [Candidatus Lokiarchaeota archaeon]|nr:GNAT family N-acetyltransferase [Candidatus Lokiarchaeota archaeon]